MAAIAPGKVILSGEHAVVYGAPAVAVACREHIQARFEPDAGGQLRLHGDGFDGQIAVDRLPALAGELDHRYQRFEAGELAVSALLDRPEQLLFYVLACRHLALPGTLTTTSTLPTGAGMGSSAAAIAATLLVAEQFGALPLSQSDRFAMLRHCERLQHGRGSAIDAAAVTYGGLVRVQGDEVQQLKLPLGEGWYRVDSGRPSVSTGECVQAVRERFADSAIWSEFAELTDQLQQGLGDPHALLAAVRDNHRLLATIGVVPVPVQRFIAAAEQAGGAAKISGAGAHRGEHGGLVLLYWPDGDPASLCAQFGYPVAPLQEDSQGARLVKD
ncbi:mevalonate kinase family protein [Marinobacterium arenosum]|uniref:mevalonate kinase family protein n=1 Tax=Marinobacterium arenosum TaxID=2862496 RepID=UPI001C942DC7|nr:mevalonate kinase [Marinobacterium arenosum]MBY4677283.1 mevalonate kinase [Marinobacterium arenosum]